MTSTLAQQKTQDPEWTHWLLLSRNIFETRFPEMDLRPPKKYLSEYFSSSQRSCTVCIVIALIFTCIIVQIPTLAVGIAGN